MAAAVADWVVVGCSIASMCGSLAVLVSHHVVEPLRRRAEDGHVVRRDSYIAIVALAARIGERFQSAAIRQKLLRQRSDNAELSGYVDEDLAGGWVELEELRKRLQADQMICSDKVLALVSDASSKYFWNAESMFRLYGHTALDLDDLHKHAQDLIAKLKQRCQREIGLKR